MSASLTLPSARYPGYNWVRKHVRPVSERGNVIDEPATLDNLLRRCAAADRSALRELYDRESSRLYGQALRITRQPSLAADAVQDTFLQVWQQAARFDPSRGAAGAWLSTLLRFRAIDITRRRQREYPGFEIPEQEDPSPDALSVLVGSAEADALRACLATLDEKRRQLILMAFVEGLSHTELADKLAAPLGSIKSWIRRSLAALKMCLTS